jgi:hypothetical protein
MAQPSPSPIAVAVGLLGCALHAYGMLEVLAHTLAESHNSLKTPTQVTFVAASWLGLALLLVSLGQYARSRGRSILWALLAAFSIPGFLLGCILLWILPWRQVSLSGENQH